MISNGIALSKSAPALYPEEQNVQISIKRLPISMSMKDLSLPSPLLSLTQDTFDLVKLV